MQRALGVVAERKHRPQPRISAATKDKKWKNALDDSPPSGLSSNVFLDSITTQHPYSAPRGFELDVQQQRRKGETHHKLWMRVVWSNISPQPLVMLLNSPHLRKLGLLADCESRGVFVGDKLLFDSCVDMIDCSSTRGGGAACASIISLSHVRTGFGSRSKRTHAENGT